MSVMRGKIVFLGTSAGVPTKERGLSSIALLWGGEVILFDIGEGTQHIMIKGGISPMKVSKILITHLHGDHILGLPGLLMTMALMGREEPLSVFGPKGLNKLLACLMPAIYEEDAEFSVRSSEIDKAGVVLGERDYMILAAPSRHSVESWAFRFEERDRPGKFDEKAAKRLEVPPGSVRSKLIEGKPVKLGGRVIRPGDVVGPPRPGFKMVYTGDTTFSEGIVKFAKGVDLLIHEATFESSKVEAAGKVMHSVSSDAAKVAVMAGVKQLILTHISARYQDTGTLLSEAQKVFSNTKIAHDLMEYVMD